MYKLHSTNTYLEILTSSTWAWDSWSFFWESVGFLVLAPLLSAMTAKTKRKSKQYYYKQLSWNYNLNTSCNNNTQLKQPTFTEIDLHISRQTTVQHCTFVAYSKQQCNTSYTICSKILIINVRNEKSVHVVFTCTHETFGKHQNK